jgi:hypothetical protein
VLDKYERQALHELERQLEAEDRDLVASFRSWAGRGPGRYGSLLIASTCVVSVLLGALLTILGNPGSALPALALALCLWCLSKYRRNRETQQLRRDSNSQS